MSNQLPSFLVARYTDADLKRIRNEDRMSYRKGVIWLVVYQIVVAGPVRIALDTLASHKIFYGLQPFIIPIIVGLVLCIWGIGILYIFGRKYK
jgi:FtsH-binding integral membrane protein